MNKKMILLAVAVSVLALLAGCGAGNENKDLNQNQNQNDEAEAVTSDGLTAGIEQQASETEANEELRQLIAEYYEIPDYELADSRYYYNYVDLDGDGTEEIFALVVGSYTSGTSGSSALWCAKEDGVLTVRQAFTLVNNPVIVTDSPEGGYKELILQRMSGDGSMEDVILTCQDGLYTSVGDAEPVQDIDSIQGTAILCNDLAEDMQTGNYLTLAP